MSVDLRHAASNRQQDEQLREEAKRHAKSQVAMQYLMQVPKYAALDLAEGKEVINPSYDESVAKQANRVVLGYLNRE